VKWCQPLASMKCRRAHPGDKSRHRDGCKPRVSDATSFGPGVHIRGGMPKGRKGCASTISHSVRDGIGRTHVPQAVEGLHAQQLRAESVQCWYAP
jgi:hypothetical protein